MSQTADKPRQDPTRALFDVGHPADLHFFAAAAGQLRQEGAETLFLLRRREPIPAIAQRLGLAYVQGSTWRRGKGLALEFWNWLRHATAAIRRFRPDIYVSVGSPAGAIAAALSRTPHLVFNDTETAWEQRCVFLPLCREVHTPASYLLELGRKHHRYQGVKELAYLAAKRFTPSWEHPAAAGIKQGERFAVVRFVAWGASHDALARRTRADARRQILDNIANSMPCLVCAEDGCESLSLPAGATPLAAPPGTFHHFLACASLVVSDGSTTAAEAAVLGTPSVYVSTFAQRLGYIRCLGDKGLLYATPSYFEGLKRIEEMIAAGTPRNDQAAAAFQASCEDVAAYVASQCLRLCHHPSPSTSHP